MRALRFEKTGSLDELSLKEIPRPNPGPGEVVVQVRAAAINPSDIKNVLGKMHETTLPRTPGRDFAGTVVEGEGIGAGTAVFGSGGELGFKRDGTHAEFLAMPKAGIVPIPNRFTFEQSAAIGIPYITAWAALVKTARLQPHETVLIVGATGAVGSAAAQIAHSLGARVLGTVRNASSAGKSRELPVDSWIRLDMRTRQPAC